MIVLRLDLSSSFGNWCWCCEKWLCTCTCKVCNTWHFSFHKKAYSVARACFNNKL